MNLSSQQAFSSKAAKLLSWGHWFTFANILFALIVSSLYLVSDPMPMTFSGKVFLLLNWLGHISFLTFLCFVLTIFPLSLIFPYPRHIRGMAAVIATFTMSLLALDAYVYFQLGYHLSPQVFEQIVSLISDTISTNPSLSLFIAGGIIFVILFFELIASNFTWRHLTELRQKPFRRYISPVFIVAFVASHLLHIWADANVKLDITKQDNVLPLSYPTTAKSLLARYQLVDLDEYKEAQNVSFANEKVTYVAPNQPLTCNTNSASAEILVFDNQALLNQYLSDKALNATDNFYQPANKRESLFNLVYGLPSYYQKVIRAQGILPAWSNSVNASFINLPRLAEDENAILTVHYVKTQDELATIKNSVVDFAFSLANSEEDAWSKSTLYTAAHITPAGIITPQDVITTVLANTFNCQNVQNTTLGNNLYNGSDTGVNISGNTLLIYKKDKLTLLTSDGKHETVSAQQGFAIDSHLEVPFLVQSLKKLKQFEQ
ncbi:DUF3413 domain-containing protein [Pseudoalteromonas spongiae]|uniref:DUF3413 domain-containing protein n=1 Tax=Pseudoalteromonas spongiae TaxID=298657 RepID=A0ABU8ETU2_9GAMM